MNEPLSSTHASWLGRPCRCWGMGRTQVSRAAPSQVAVGTTSTPATVLSRASGLGPGAEDGADLLLCHWPESDLL